MIVFLNTKLPSIGPTNQFKLIFEIFIYRLPKNNSDRILLFPNILENTKQIKIIIPEKTTAFK